MSLGTSLIWIAVLALLVYGIRLITKKKKWRLVIKVIAVLILLGILIGLGVWGWSVYKDRPQPVDTLGSISLGMTPIDVTLAVGKPTQEILPNELDTSRRYIYEGYGGDLKYTIKFSGSDETPVDVVQVVCTGDYMNEVFGLGKYDSEKDVIKKLGSPSNQSIRADGLAKMISYEKWNVAFEIQQGDVTKTCISSSGKVTYLKEYGEDSI